MDVRNVRVGHLNTTLNSVRGNLTELTFLNSVGIEFKIRRDGIANDFTDVRQLKSYGLTISNDIDTEVDDAASRRDYHRNNNSEVLRDVIRRGKGGGSDNGGIEICGGDTAVVQEALVDLRETRVTGKQGRRVDWKNDGARNDSLSGRSNISIGTDGRRRLRAREDRVISDALELRESRPAMANRK